MASQDIIGKVLNHRYRVEKLIARGGMASVYLAEDERLERQVAIKVIHAHLSDDPSFQTKFLREAKIVAKLSHPNIVNIFDQGQDGEFTYLVMEYVPSITLREALTRFGAIPAKRSLELFQYILEGLSAAHQLGILHRDIKPENVFLADDGRIKLGDFGLARNIDSHTNTGSLIGTIAYLSPELITRGQADARSDVYASGIVLFEMLTGRQPFQGEEAAHIAHQHTNSDMPTPSTLNNSIPAIVDELVLWATARAANHRPADAGEFLLVTRKVSDELKAGRGATARLELPELAKTRMLSPGELDSNATAVLDDLVGTFDDSVDSVISQHSTLDLSADLAATATYNFGEMMSDSGPLERFSARRKIRARVLAFTVPALCVIATLLGWWLSAGPGGFGGLPELKNLTLEQARSELEPFSPQISESRVNSATVPAGRVVGSEPGAGSWFFRGSSLKLLISKGPVMVKVPNLLGLTAAEAADSLKSSDLTLGEKNESFNADIVAGEIYDYQGSDGTKVAQNSEITIEVSLGALPEVLNKTQEAAIAALGSAQLTIAATTSEYSETVAKGLAIRIDPMQNPLRIGGEVTLVLSKGPTTVTVPNVVGETLDAAKKLLRSIGLKVQIDTDQLTAQWGIVKVKHQSVDANTQLHVGDTVIISSK